MCLIISAIMFVFCLAAYVLVAQNLLTLWGLIFSLLGFAGNLVLEIIYCKSGIKRR